MAQQKQNLHRRTRSGLLSLVVGTLTAVLPASPLIAQPSFEIIDLGVLAGEDNVVWANAINELDQITGGYGPGDLPSSSAYLWEDGSMIKLIGGNDRYEGVSINESGWIVIGREDFMGFFQSRLWKPGIGIVDLMIPFSNIPYEISDHGQIALSEIGQFGSFFHAYTWREGILTQLFEGTFDISQARGLNNRGRIVGEAGTQQHATVWPDAGTIIDIHPPDTAFSRAEDINDADQIVGVFQTFVGGPLHVFLLDNGRYTDLTILDYDEISWVFRFTKLNNAGEVVGWDPVPPYNSAFLVRQGVRYNLIDLIDDPDWITLQGAHGINDAGRIVGIGGRLINGVRRGRAFLMIPKDEFRTTGPMPGLAGEPNRINAYNATPDGRVLFAFGFAKGEFTLPPRLCPGGVTLGIANPRFAGFAIADANGNVNFQRMVSPLAEGRTIYLQALDLATCETSPVLAHHFPTR